MRKRLLGATASQSPVVKGPRWAAVCTRIDLRTGETKQTCMYCYRPWHYDHYCGEPE